jgi:hypothetical protein
MISPLTKNLEKIISAKRPNTITEVQSFIGLINYYRRFIKDFYLLSRPFQLLLSNRKTTKGTEQIYWNDELEETFKKVMTLFAVPPILALPDFEKPFKLSTDASGVGYGGQLSQEQETPEGLYDHPISYFGGPFNKSQKEGWPTWKKEGFAIIKGVNILNLSTIHYRN